MGKKEAKSNYVHYVPAAKRVPEWYKLYDFILVTSMEQLDKVFKDSNWTPGKSFISFDTETTDLNPEELELVGYSFCIDGHKTYYVPINHFQYEHNLGESAVKYIYLRMCEARLVFMFNARFDEKTFEWRGFKENRDVLDNKRWTYVKYDMSKVKVMDVCNHVWNADTNIKMPSLKDSSLHWLGYEQMHFDEVIEGAGNFYYLNPSENPDTVYYAGADALCTYLLVPAVMKYYKEAGIAGQLDDAVIYPLMHYEAEKLWLDYDKICKMLKECEETAEKTEKEVYDTLGYQINLNSPVQVSQALERLGIDTGVRTETGNMAVGTKVLEDMPEEMRKKFPALDAYVRFKELEKLSGTYFSTYKKEAERRGYLRGSYKTTQVPTGRLACGKDAKNTFFSPCNLQAIPKPHVKMYDVFDLGDRSLVSKKDKIILGYQFIESRYDENGHVVPDDPRYMGQSEGMDQHLNVRSCITPKMYKDSGDDEFVYCSCDYAAEEIRLTANISREPVWLNALVSGGDVHKSCYSTDTEFLTEDGFKTYESISRDTKIAQYNESTGKIEYVKAGKLYRNDAKEMYHFVGSGTDLMVSGNHRMYAKTSSKYKILIASDLIYRNYYNILNGADIAEEFTSGVDDIVIKKEAFMEKDLTISMMDFCEMLGYFMSRGGTYTGEKGEPRTYISQKGDNLEGLEEMRDLNKRLGNIFSERVNEITGIHTFKSRRVNLYDYMRSEFGGSLKEERKLPKWFKNLPKEYITKFIEAFVGEDKLYCIGKERSSVYVTIHSKELLDDVQYMLMRLGHRSDWKAVTCGLGDVYRLHITFNRIETRINRDMCEIVKIRGEEEMICYSVPSGLLVVRRDGKISICGNTAIALWGEENYNRDYRKKAKSANFCSADSNLILTKEHGYIRADELSIADTLYNRDGEEVKIRGLQRLDDQECIEFTFTSGLKASFRKQHKLLCNVGGQSEWVHVEDLTGESEVITYTDKNDSIEYKSNTKFIEHCNNIDVNSSGFAYISGLYFDKGYSEVDYGVCNIYIPVDRRLINDTYERIIGLGLDKKYVTKEADKIRVSNREFSALMLSFFGEEKKIPNYVFSNWCKTSVRAFINGYTVSVGGIDFCSRDLDTISNISLLCHYIGMQTTLSEKEEGLYELVINKSSQSYINWYTSNILKSEEYTGTIIAIECETHEYIDTSMCSHNSIIYGAGAASFNDPKYDIYTLADAEEFYNNYKKALPTLFQWEDRVQRRARKNGTISTYFGRPRRVKGFYDNHNASFANRTAVNTVIQGTAGDILKLVMVRLWRRLLNNPEYRDDVRFMITIHDEIGYSVRATRLEEILGIIEDTQTVKLNEWPVPIIAEPAIGFSLGEIWDFHREEDPNSPLGYRYVPNLA